MDVIFTSYSVNASDMEVDSGVDWRSFLMHVTSRLTEWEWVLASAFLSCHFPLIAQMRWSEQCQDTVWVCYRSDSALVDFSPGSAG